MARDRSTPCPICGKKLSTKSHMFRHVTSIHKTDPNSLDLEIVKIADTKKVDFQCSICLSIYKSKKKLRRHEKMKHIGWKCPECSETVLNSLEAHLKKMHGIREFSFKCNLCEKSFASEKSLDLHVRYHKFTDGVCPKCGEKFDNIKDYTKHLATHPKPKGEKRRRKTWKCVCPICGKTVSNHSLKGHLETHTEERTVKCEMCDKAFRTRPMLVLHMRTHTQERPYGCPHCDKRFIDPSTARVHQRCHTGESPYLCHLCGRRTKQAQNLRSHYVHYHRDNDMSSRKIRYNSKVFALYSHQELESRLATDGTLVDLLSEGTIKYEKLQAEKQNSIKTEEKPKDKEEYLDNEPTNEEANFKNSVFFGDENNSSEEYLSDTFEDDFNYDPLNENEADGSNGIEENDESDLKPEKISIVKFEENSILFEIEEVEKSDLSFAEVKIEPCWSDNEIETVDESTAAVPDEIIETSENIKSDDDDFVDWWDERYVPSLSGSEPETSEWPVSVEYDVKTEDSEITNVDVRPNTMTSTKPVKRSKTITCDLCNKHFKKSQAFRNHLRKKHDASNIDFKYIEENSALPCLYDGCNAILSSSHVFKKHTDFSFECFVCHLPFRRRYTLKEHIVHNHSDVKFLCDICGVELRTKKSLGRHIVSTHSNETHICSICDKVYNCKNNLINHMRHVHEGKRRVYQCPKCPKQFFTKISLESHDNLHLGITPFKCSFCGHGFREKKSLEEHERLHTGEKPYYCHLCDRQTAQAGNMKSHYRHFHKVIVKIVRKYKRGSDDDIIQYLPGYTKSGHDVQPGYIINDL